MEHNPFIISPKLVGTAFVLTLKLNIESLKVI